MEFHSSKWRIFAYQIFLGVLFAFGTVLGLVFLSWTTYTFFKDSAVLRGVVDNQLRMRQFDIKEIREKAKSDFELGSTGKTAPEATTSTGNKSATGSAVSKTPVPKTK